MEPRTILQANTVENIIKLQQLGTVSRHFAEDFGNTFDTFNYKQFEGFIYLINAPVEEKVVDINSALRYWSHPTGFNCSLGPVNRADGCSWLMTKQQWQTFGPMPTVQYNVTGDVIIHDRMQQAGYESFIVRDCVTYHFVQGESS